MSGKKGAKWRKEKVIKYKKNIQLNADDMELVDSISHSAEWSEAKVIYKIFEKGKSFFIKNIIGN